MRDINGERVFVTRSERAAGEVTWWRGADGAMYQETLVGGGRREVIRVPIGGTDDYTREVEAVPSDAVLCHVDGRRRQGDAEVWTLTAAGERDSFEVWMVGLARP